MKPIVIVIIVFLVLLAIGVFVFFSNIGKPLYKPSSVSNPDTLRSPLEPPVQDGTAQDKWKVEDDIELYHFSEGEGQNILFIHGYALDPPSESIIGLDSLSGYKVHYYHQRGAGYSTRPIDKFESDNFYQNMMEMDSKLGIAASIADIERIRRLLKDDKLILVGHSYGGFIASLYAAEFPENVEKLILIAPANVVRMPQKGKGLYDAVIEHLPESMHEEYNEWVKEHFDYGNIFTKSEIELAVHNLKMSEYYEIASKSMGMEIQNVEVNPEYAAGWLIHAYNFSLGKRYDLRDFLSNITAETIIFQGTGDLTGENEVKDYTDSIQNSELILVDGSGHFLMSEDNSQFRIALSEFLEGE